MSWSWRVRGVLVGCLVWGSGCSDKHDDDIVIAPYGPLDASVDMDAATDAGGHSGSDAQVETGHIDSGMDAGAH